MSAKVIEFLRKDCKRRIDHIVPDSDRRDKKPRQCPDLLPMGYIDPTNPVEGGRSNTSVFQFTRNFAINQLQGAVASQLDIIADGKLCRGSPGIIEDAISKGLFNWKWDLFKERLKAGNAWLNVVEKKLSAECLENLKLKLDVRQLNSLLIPLLESFLNSTEPIDKSKLEECVLKPIIEASDFLSLYECLQKNQKRQNRVSKELLVAAEMKAQIKKPSGLIAGYQNKITDYDIEIPIAFRYASNYYKFTTAERKDVKKAEIEDVQSEYQKYQDKIKTGRFCSQQICNFYHSEIKRYRSEISRYMHMFDIENDHIDNKIAYTSISMGKMTEQHQAMLNEIDRFHVAIERVLREEQELREQEERRLEEERMIAAEAAKLAAKQAAKAAKLAAKQAGKAAKAGIKKKK